MLPSSPAALLKAEPVLAHAAALAPIRGDLASCSESRISGWRVRMNECCEQNTIAAIMGLDKLGAGAVAVAVDAALGEQAYIRFKVKGYSCRVYCIYTFSCHGS
jgi:hypothetical protein